MSRKNPIKFLDSYSREDKDIFFGRDKETSVLYEKVGQSKIVLLYGLSGTGKTSLINCGLENRYEADQRIFIYVRRGNNILKSFRQSVTAEASSLIHPNATPAEALEILYYDYLKPIIIIFDQFEELFISGDYDEKRIFISTVASILNSDLNIKFIFSLREEYLAYIDEFEEKIPIIYDHRHRLEKMRHSTLEEVITRIADKGDTELENDRIPGMIIDNISDRKGNVELPYLQVYLDKLTRLMNTTNNGKVFTIKLVEQAGKLEDVLGDFLEEQITRIASETGNKEAVNQILKQLITPDGTKKQLVFADIKPYGNMSPDQLKGILTKLEQSRIIKLDDNIYELSHDSLAGKIAEKRTSEEIQLIEVIKFLKNASNSFRQTDTLLNRKQLKYIQPYLVKIDLTADEKKLLDNSYSRERQMKLLWISIYVFIFIAILAGGYYWQKMKYNGIKKKADSYMSEAKYSEAKLVYEQAISGLRFVSEKAAKDSIVRCDTLIKKELPYKKLIRSGDSLFNMGVSNYKSAFQRYHSAKRTGFNPLEINSLLAERTEDAVNKYIELAKIEYDARHVNLAFALISEAYVLEGRMDVMDQINKWLAEAKPGDLDTVIDQLQSTVNTEKEENDRAKSLLSKYIEKQTNL